MDPAIYRVWRYLRIVGAGVERTFDLDPYRYKMVRGIDYYRLTRDALARCPNVTMLQARVEAIEDGNERARVWVDGQAHSASWVFDSRYAAEEFAPDARRYHDLKQHFRGWVIEAEADCFDPAIPTWFDFRTPQRGALRFLYILPFSAREALVEYTLFSTNLLTESEYEEALGEYIESVLRLRSYRILERETGRIPMTDQPFPRRAGNRVLNTGTRGGRVKASTGFAFLRTQRDSVSIIASLLRHGHPFALPSPPRRYALFDSTMLQVMARRGDDCAGLYAQLFRNNPIQRLLGFLDERNTWWQDLQVLASLPAWPFLQALWRIRVLGRI